jgi:hypothetical protein
MDKKYQAYLIRFERRAAQSSWCATLEDVHTRETLSFATERELLVYLLESLSEKSKVPGVGATTKKGENHESHS